MEYTVQELANLAGVSARTLRYYDGIGLLKPARLTPAGYRLYGAAEVDRLQQILFYRELEVPLETIAALLDAPDYDRMGALRAHRGQLLQKRARIDRLLDNLQRSIAAGEGGREMTDTEKFAGFLRERVEQNEAQYGPEIRERYGDAAVDGANARMCGLSPDEYGAMQRCETEVLRRLDEMAACGGDPTAEAGRELAEAHRAWLGYSWAAYSPEAHCGLAQLYLADDRFTAYYDRGTPGRAALLHDAIVHWAPRL